LTVFDNDGAPGYDTAGIIANDPANDPPTAILTADPLSGDAPLLVTFNMSANDTDGTIASWELDIDNDGTAEYSGAGDPPATQQHTYNDPGVYTAELTVFDNDGAPGYDTAGVTVNESTNQPPTAALTADSTAGDAPLTVTFSMIAHDTDGAIASWELNIDNQGAAEFFGFGEPPANMPFTYDTPGTYKARLMVRDDDQALGFDTVTITVDPRSGFQPGTEFMEDTKQPEEDDSASIPPRKGTPPNGAETD
jgi:PKD repeat protein